MTVKLYRGANLTELLRICYVLPQDERDQFEAFTGNTYSHDVLASTLYLRPGPSWTIAVGDEAGFRPIMAAGFDEIRPGVWQDWAVTTPEAWAVHWRPVTRISRRVMDEMLQTRAHRLQCVSLACRVSAHKWYRPLGLVQEGVLHGYGANGEDAIMFSRLRSP